MSLNPARLSLRAASWLINPRGGPSGGKLREAVAGKVVLVTGASYGIGEATARKLAGAGATVLLVARSADKLEDLRAEIERDGGEAFAYPADLADPESVEALAAHVLDAHGHVDVIVNNAGKSIRRSIELSYERFHDFERTIDINYLGPVKLLLALLPSMRERKQGHIVNVSTVGVRVPPAPRWAAYQASKAAFDVFLRSVALEARGDGVTTTSIYMALVRTRMSAPTASLRNVPGLRPDQAADLVCRAIVERPGVISPWWSGPVEAGAALARWPWEVAMRLAFQNTGDAQPAPERDAEDRPVARGRS
jgi:NAD(P)-dependent dehydrogenase (short-subunit alcohol dehydrogenase family)